MSTAAAMMTGPKASELLQAALTGEPGAAVPEFHCAVDQVHDRVGSETSVTYHVSYRSDAGPVTEYLVATTAPVPSAATVLMDSVHVQVWRHPADPGLPGLAGACNPQVLASWLPDAGQRTDTPLAGNDVEDTRGVDTEVLVYRPLRRAVLRTARGDDVYFTKVVRPKMDQMMVRRHELLAGLGPDIVATPEPGVLITSKVPGSSLAVALSAWQLGESDRRPDPCDAVALLDRLPQQVVTLPERPSWTDRVDFYRDMAARALPEHAREIAMLAAEISSMAQRFPVGPIVATHGDFHEGNVFCEEGIPTRMIDIDTVGPGRREDDLACMIAHLAVLPDLSAGHYPRGSEVTDCWSAAFEDAVHPGALRVRVAGVLLSLVSGPDRARALTRLDLTRAWVWRAGLAERVS